MKWRLALVLAAVSALTPAYVRATTYYVDSHKGDDSALGTSPSRPWKTLEKVDEALFHPGDHILFRCGSRWKGQLSLTSSGAEGAPIVIDWYGKGPLPRIDGEGRVEDVVRLENVQQVEVHHLQITNHGASPGLRRAVLIAVTNFGTAHHVVVSGLYIHDVNGTNERKNNGGIFFRATGDKVPSRFDGLMIEQNIVWKVDRTAIAGESDETDRTRWFPSLHVVIRDNFVDRIGGDGIVPIATDGALIEGNIALHCNQHAESFNAGMWPWSADNSVFKLNEAAYTRTTRDGEGFDSDFNSRNTHFLYDYSHDNDGGFMLICTPVERNDSKNIGNEGTVIDHNISRDDHNLIFNLSGADHSIVANNAIYTAPHDDVQLLVVSPWKGWSNDARFTTNVFDVAGTGRFGHSLRRNSDGSYEIGLGWGGAKDIQFQGNCYFGKIMDIPPDSTAIIDPHYRPAMLNWNEPAFNPAHPRSFPAYLVKHRQWMLQLFTTQFGTVPEIRAAQAAAKAHGDRVYPTAAFRTRHSRHAELAMFIHSTR